jgi:hypothetical protein
MYALGSGASEEVVKLLLAETPNINAADVVNR